MGNNPHMNLPKSSSGVAIGWAPATADDAAALSGLFNTVAESDDTPERLSPETMAHELQSAFAPLDERTVVARVDGSVVAYGTVYHRDADAADLRTYIAAYVAPSHRNRGIEDAILDWATAAARGVLSNASAPRTYICSWLYKQQQDAAARLADRGFAPVRHWWEMERILDTAASVAMPVDVEIVPWADHHSGPVRVVANAAFADHWGSTPMDKGDWQKRMLDSPGFRQDLSFVALHGDQIVGYAYNEVYEEDWEAAGRSEGWIGALGVLREWRKKGIATALLAASMNAMRGAGLDAAMIGVDSSSPSGAQHLYQSVGFSTTSTGTTWQLELID